MRKLRPAVETTGKKKIVLSRPFRAAIGYILRQEGIF